MSYLIFAGFAFLFLLALDIYTSRHNYEDVHGVDLTPDDLADMELIDRPIERGEA